MNVKVPLVLLLLLAAVVGYLLGTEKGRTQRDTVIGKVRERRSDTDVVDLNEPTSGATEQAAEAAAPSN